jgi:tetratricopeptide (TPR) repeat protein
MRLPKIFHVVLSILFTASIPSQQVLGSPLSKRPAGRATVVRPLITPAHAEAIYRRLVEFHWTPKTGLFRGFPDSSDLKLSQQASTYDQAAMGILALRFGDLEHARPLLQFFRTAWDTGPDREGTRHGLRGLANFYNADFGTEGIEKTIHVGPNAWAGLFAARLANQTKGRDALQLALDIEYWIANVIPHEKGGVAMGARDDVYGATWSHIFSTENNISYYAFLTELLRSPVLDKAVRVAVTAERNQVENWLVNEAYDTKRGRMRRGFNPQGADTMQVLDTTTWFLSAIGPRRLAVRGIDPERLMLNAEQAFEVTIGGRRGVDATDQDEADRTFADLRSRPDEINRPLNNRHRVIWYEGLGQYILAWNQLAEYEGHAGKPDKASIYRRKAELLTREFDRAALSRVPALSAYPYATPGKFFRFGWGAPKESDDGPAASLIAGIWRCFAGLGMDPLSGRELVSPADRVRLSPPQQIHLAERRSAVLYGTSEDMTREAWKALDAGDFDRAIDQAKATIQEWSSAALYLQEKKSREIGHLVDYTGDPAERKKIFEYWALNDVASAYFILGQACDRKGYYTQASRAFQQIVNHYSLAQVWDPKGWFWSPVDAITNDYVLRDQAHYRWVLPQVFAQNSKFGKQPL